MKTCKTGCGKMKAGGSVKKVKKMATGGQALNNARGYAKPQTGGDNVKMGIYGAPNAGTTGPNRTAGYEYKKGGVAKAKFGASTPVKESCKKGMVRGADGKCVMSRPKFKSGGSFGMLSVKAGIDKNPNPTAADRIAGAKMNKKKMGGSTKRK